jgi:hypothetical protein
MGVLDFFKSKPKLNRKGRRTEAALARKAPHRNRVARFREHIKNQAERRQAGLEYRLRKVREATRKRKGRCNNPRFN